MHVLLTGANGYIGQRLLPLLVKAGHHVTCLVRDPRRFELPESLLSQVSVVQGDLLKPDSLRELPTDLDAAYYLVHSMSGHAKDFFRLEQQSAHNFTAYLNRTTTRQCIFARARAWRKCSAKAGRPSPCCGPASSLAPARPRSRLFGTWWKSCP
jgi:uncharacterized protein YbjT (DUF2867 family)